MQSSETKKIPVPAIRLLLKIFVDYYSIQSAEQLFSMIDEETYQKVSSEIKTSKTITQTIQRYDEDEEETVDNKIYLEEITNKFLVAINSKDDPIKVLRVLFDDLLSQSIYHQYSSYNSYLKNLKECLERNCIFLT